MQNTGDMSPEMMEDVEAKRDWVRNHYTPETIHEYDSFEGKLHLLDVILTSDWIASHETVKLQSLGITLGDVFVQDMGFKWVEVEDEYGTDPAIAYPNSSMLLFPMTMISKRVERGESIEIYSFYNGLREKINEVR